MKVWGLASCSESGGLRGAALPPGGSLGEVDAHPSSCTGVGRRHQFRPRGCQGNTQSQRNSSQGGTRPSSPWRPFTPAVSPASLVREGGDCTRGEARRITGSAGWPQHGNTLRWISFTLNEHLLAAWCVSNVVLRFVAKDHTSDKNLTVTLFNLHVFLQKELALQRDAETASDTKA